MLLLFSLLCCSSSPSDARCDLLCEEKANDHARIWLGLELDQPVPYRAEMPKDVADKAHCVQETCERDSCGDPGVVLELCDTLDLSLPPEPELTPQ